MLDLDEDPNYRLFLQNLAEYFFENIWQDERRLNSQDYFLL